MPLDPRVRRFLDLLAATNPTDTRALTVTERRASIVQLLGFCGTPTAVANVEARTLTGASGPLPARIYTAAAAPDPIGASIVYFHGGGLVAGSIETHDPVARALCNWSGCRVVSVGYRLAPEHPFPAALTDASTAFRNVRNEAAALGADPARVVIAGDSAGATLAAAVCQILAQTGEPQPALQVLLCPILDHAGSWLSRRQFGTGYLVDDGTLEHDLRHYLPAGTPLDDPRVSPLRASSLGGLAPAVIHAAEFDPLRDEARAYAERLTEAGGSASYTCHPGMIHFFYGLGGVIPYAHQALQKIGVQIRAALQ